MSLKFLTTGLVLFGLALLLAYPWIVGPAPEKGAPKEVQKSWAVRGLAFMGAEAIILASAAVSAYILARRIRTEYREQAMHNMEILIETTLQDHRKKQPQPEEE